MANSSIQAGHQGHALPLGLRFHRDHAQSTPEKSLTEPLKKSGGRDNHGHISMRRVGGGHKRKYRIIDFKRNKHGLAATVREIEYDPNRSARIALVEYADGEKRYILHPKGLSVGDIDRVGPGLGRAHRQRAAAAARCRSAPPCTTSSSSSARADRSARSAGMSAQVVAKEGEYVTLRMPSTEMRLVHGTLPRDDRRGRQRRARARCRGARRARARWLGTASEGAR